VIGSPESPFAPRRSLVRPVFFNCLTLVVIFTLCLYGLGVVGLYLHWFVLNAAPTETPTPIIVTIVMTAEPGSEQEPIIITVVATRPPDNSRPPTATLEPTPTQWWPPAKPTEGATPVAATPGPADLGDTTATGSDEPATAAAPAAGPFLQPPPRTATPPF